MSGPSQVRKNAAKNPDYCPYCLRCRELVRMKKVEPLLWKCDCGAVHDERNNKLVQVHYNSRTVLAVVLHPQPIDLRDYEVTVEAEVFGRLTVHKDNITELPAEGTT